MLRTKLRSASYDGWIYIDPSAVVAVRECPYDARWSELWLQGGSSFTVGHQIDVVAKMLYDDARRPTTPL